MRAIQKIIILERDKDSQPNIALGRRLACDIAPEYKMFQANIVSFAEQIATKIFENGLDDSRFAELAKLLASNALSAYLNNPVDAIFSQIKSDFRGCKEAFPEELHSLINHLVTQGDGLRHDVYNTEVKGELYNVAPGNSFDSTQHDLVPDCGCPKEGIVKFTVCPGYKTQDKSTTTWVKPLVYTELEPTASVHRSQSEIPSSEISMQESQSFSNNADQKQRARGKHLQNPQTTEEGEANNACP